MKLLDTEWTNQRVKTPGCPLLGSLHTFLGLNQGAPSDSYGENRRKIVLARKKGKVTVLKYVQSVLCNKGLLCKGNYFIRVLFDLVEKGNETTLALFSLPSHVRRGRKKTHLWSYNPGLKLIEILRFNNRIIENFLSPTLYHHSTGSSIITVNYNWESAKHIPYLGKSSEQIQRQQGRSKRTLKPLALKAIVVLNTAYLPTQLTWNLTLKNPIITFLIIQNIMSSLQRKNYKKC